jgi:cell division protein FtsZ
VKPKRRPIKAAFYYLVESLIMIEDVMLMGVGDFGGQLVNSLAAEVGGRVRCVLVNSSPVLEPAPRVSDWLLVAQEGCRGDADLARRALEANLPQLRSLLMWTSEVVLAAGLGGGTGSGVLPMIAREAQALGKPVRVFLTFPVSVGSTDRIGMANAALDELQALGVPAEVVYWEDLSVRDGYYYQEELYGQMGARLETLVRQAIAPG